MVQAWFINDIIEDCRDDNYSHSSKNVTIEELNKNIGVKYWKVDADNYEKEGLFKKICDEGGYTYVDEITCSPDKLLNYQEKLNSFFEEHIHSDDEIRFVLEGSGFFDCRDLNDLWIRIKVEKNDLIVLPAGIYHRFTLDKSDYIRVKRMFKGEPVWTPINRPADDHPVRKKYLKSFEAVKI